MAPRGRRAVACLLEIRLCGAVFWCLNVLGPFGGEQDGRGPNKRLAGYQAPQSRPLIVVPHDGAGGACEQA